MTRPVAPAEQHRFQQDSDSPAPRCTCGELYRAPVHCPGVAEYGHGLTTRTVHNGCCSAA